MSRGTLWVVGVGGRGGVVVAQSGPDANVYGVLGREARVASLGSGSDAWPAASGASAWVQSRAGKSRCLVRLMALNGGQLSVPHPFPCATTSDPAGGSLGLVVKRTVVDPATGRTVLQARAGILAVAGKKLLLIGPVNQLALLDAATGRERRLGWPSTLAGLDEPAVDPRGRYVAIAFADPSWGQGKQVLDVWILDTRTGLLRQLPGMPAFVSLKFTSIAWTHDGLLVILGESAGKDRVAIWRLGWKRLALKTIRLPERNGVSDTFAPLR